MSLTTAAHQVQSLINEGAQLFCGIGVYLDVNRPVRIVLADKAAIKVNENVELDFRDGLVCSPSPIHVAE